MRSEQFAQFHKSSHDRDVYLNRSLALKHAREHRDTLFGEYQGEITASAPT
jgi:hypothetical protein